MPHHGPIIPTIAHDHTLVPRTGTHRRSASRYTGYDPTFEIRALWNLGARTTVDDGFKALDDFSYGSQNWTMIDNSGNIGWTTQALVPWRAPATYAWDPVTNPDGPAPFFVLPGDGTDRVGGPHGQPLRPARDRSGAGLPRHRERGPGRRDVRQQRRSTSRWSTAARSTPA